MRYVDLLRRPVPLLLWIGQVTSTAGDRLYGMAVLWIALELTGSTRAMALVSLFESIPLAVVGLVAGALADRWNRLRAMIVVDVLRALLVLSLPMAYLMGSLQLWHLLMVGIGMGALGSLFDPAMQATLPGLVSPAEFPGLAGLMDTPGRLARLLGPGLAGALLTRMPEVHFFTLDAASFVVSALCLGAIALRWAPREAAEPPGARRSLRQDLPLGWQTVRQHRGLLAVVLADGLGNLGWAAYALGAPLLAAQKLGGGMGGYGLLIAAYGIGSLAGNFAAGNLDLRAWRAWLPIGGWVGIGASFVLLGLAPAMPWALGAIALGGVCGSLAHVSRAAYLAERVPRGNLGKVYSVLRLATATLGALGMALCGWAAEAVPAGTLLVGAGVAVSLAAAGCLALGGAENKKTAQGRDLLPAPHR